MKKILITAALALAVFDAAALYMWMEHKKKAAAAVAAPKPAVETPAAAPQQSQAPEQTIQAIPAASTPCGSVESCRAYCQNPEHQQECRDMADKLRAEAAAPPAQQEGSIQPQAPASPDPFFKAVSEAGPQVTACLKKLLGAKRFQSIRAGNAPDFDEKTGRAVERCFRRKHVESSAPKRGGRRQAGPGGCSSEQACITYCSDPSHREECLASSAIPEQFKAMIRQFPQ